MSDAIQNHYVENWIIVAGDPNGQLGGRPHYPAQFDIPTAALCRRPDSQPPGDATRERHRRLQGAKHTSDAIQSGQLGPGRSRRLWSVRVWSFMAGQCRRPQEPHAAHIHLLSRRSALV